MFGYLIFLLVGTIVVLVIDILFFKSCLIDLKKYLIWLGILIFLSIIGISEPLIIQIHAKRKIQAEPIKISAPPPFPRYITDLSMVETSSDREKIAREAEMLRMELQREMENLEREARLESDKIREMVDDLEREVDYAAGEVRMKSSEIESIARDLSFARLVPPITSNPSW